MLHTKKVLVCDVCGAEQAGDKLAEELGVIVTGTFSTSSGGGTLHDAYFCLNCAATQPMMDLVWAVEPKTTKKQQRKQPKTLEDDLVIRRLHH